tara:strand:- start:14943 stop:16088 length:1146 start_codon:yes stop_codon:yes gene_type:complete
MNPENFINNGGGFAWFTGVIEDIDDPMEMGRYRVRCYGYHNNDKTETGIPTEDLPWAMTMLPVTSASMSGVGQSATGLLRGTWVVGFFRDGTNAQDPVIMGSIPSITSRPGDYSKGFSDPTERYPSNKKNADEPPIAGKPVKTNPDDEDSPEEDLGLHLNMPDTPISAQVKEEKYKQGFSYTEKKSLRELYDPEITIAVVAMDTTKPKTNASPAIWKFPAIDDVMTPTYPQNHVTAYERANDENEAAHIVEYDVTPGKERISTIHRTGTYTEVTPIGDKTEVIVGKNYRVVAKGENVYIEGGCNLTIDGGCNTRIIGDWNIQVTGNKNEHIGGTHIHRVKESQTIDIGTTITETSGDVVKETYGGDQTTIAPNIHLNPDKA